MTKPRFRSRKEMEVEVHGNPYTGTPAGVIDTHTMRIVYQSHFLEEFDANKIVTLLNLVAENKEIPGTEFKLPEKP